MTGVRFAILTFENICRSVVATSRFDAKSRRQLRKR
jgi:hypothetical protein